MRNLRFGGDKLDCKLQETGYYTFVIEDVSLNNIGDYQLYFDIIKARDVYPNYGGDTGYLTVDIIGEYFQGGAIVTLEQAGYEPIYGGYVSINDEGTTLTTRFDLQGKPRGSYQVKVKNPDNSFYVADDIFTIEEGKDQKIWIDILGREAIGQGFNLLILLTMGIKAILILKTLLSS